MSPSQVPTTFVLTNTEPQTSSFSNLPSTPAADGAGQDELRRSSSASPALSCYTNTCLSPAYGTNYALSSESPSDDDASVSSWPFSRPPSLSHFESADPECVTTRGYGILRPAAFFGSPSLPSDFSSVESGSDGRPPNVGSWHVSDSFPAPSPSPTFVMPKVSLPVRKSFTGNGLRMGKLKIIVAGDSGIGKTQLINAILSSSEDMVHVDDPVFCAQPLPGECDHDKLYASSNYGTAGIDSGVSSIAETTASTKPYPLYWLTNHEDQRGFIDDHCRHGEAPISSAPRHNSTSSESTERRRPSLIHSLESATSSDGALDRNICFVDTPGYGQDTDPMTSVSSAISYLDDKFRETARVVNASNPQVVSILTSASSLSQFPHVDVCFYMIQDRIKAVDVDYMARLSEYVPVIPLIAKSDMLSSSNIAELKLQILHSMSNAGVSPFLYDTKLEHAIEYATELVNSRHEKPESEKNESERVSTPRVGDKVHPLLIPTAVNSHRNVDAEMLASVLMSSDYKVELVDSELKDLCSYVFSEQGSAWLRFTAAKKFVKWISASQVSLLGRNELSRSLAVVKPDGDSLVPWNQQRSLGTFSVMPGFFTPLPSAALNGGSRAQVETARWAMQLEQVSRTDNVIAVREGNSVGRKSTRVRQGKRKNTAYKSSNRPPESISHMDPLNLASWYKVTSNYAVGAMTFVVGIGAALTWVYRKAILATPAKIVVEAPVESNILMKTLTSLGGGWSTLL